MYQDSNSNPLHQDSNNNSLPHPEEVSSIKKTPHIWNECNCGECYFCRSELTCCIVCGGFEGTLTTDCCGRRLTPEEEHRIYYGSNLDFRNGKWVDLPNFTRVASGLGKDTIFRCMDGQLRTKEELTAWVRELGLDDASATDEDIAREADIAPSSSKKTIKFVRIDFAPLSNQPTISSRETLEQIFHPGELDTCKFELLLLQTVIGFITKRGQGLYLITEGTILPDHSRQISCSYTRTVVNETHKPMGVLVRRTLYEHFMKHGPTGVKISLDPQLVAFLTED